MLALVRLRRFTGEGGLVILSPYYSISIISEVSDQHSVEVGYERLAFAYRPKPQLNTENYS